MTKQALHIGERLIWTGRGQPAAGEVIKVPPARVPNNGIATVREDDGTLTDIAVTQYGELYDGSGWKRESHAT